MGCRTGRRTTNALGVFLILVGVVAAGPIVTAAPALSCVPLLDETSAWTQFRGTVVAYASSGLGWTDSRVSFHISDVDQIEQPSWSLAAPMPERTFPQRGEVVDVVYPSVDADHLQLGTEYRVRARYEDALHERGWQSSALDHFTDPEESCAQDLVAGTTHTDGSLIEDPVHHSARRILAQERTLLRNVGVIAAMGLAALVFHWRRRRPPVPAV